MKPSAYQTCLWVSKVLAKPNPSLASPNHPRLPSPTPPIERDSPSRSRSLSRERVRLARHRDGHASHHVGKQSSGLSLIFHFRPHLSPLHRKSRLLHHDLFLKWHPSTTTNLYSTITIPFVQSPFATRTLWRRGNH